MNELRDGEDARCGLELPPLRLPNLRGADVRSCFSFTRIGLAFFAGRLAVFPGPLPLLPALLPGVDPLAGKVVILEVPCIGI